MKGSPFHGGVPSRERWLVLEPLMDAALELDTAARDAYLEELAHSDPTTGAELEALLRACDDSDHLFSAPAVVAFAPLLVEAETLPPSQLGPYTIIRELGRGGMATVYLADDPKHGRQVAVKVIHARVARAIGRERFMREIEIAAGLSHPHILPLHDSGEAQPGDHPELGATESILYSVSPVMTGKSLLVHMQRVGRMTCDEVVRIGRELAVALDYAHRRGVVHLDIKPGNILLQDGHAVIADFGIARAMSGADDGANGEGSLLLGTPAYMSPEQAMGIPDLDGRSDIYSLGCVLHELLTGTRPMVREAWYVAAAGPDSLGHADFTTLREKTPPALAAAVMKAMATAREDRFATSAEFALALRDSVAPKSPSSTNPRRLGLLALALVMFGAFGSLLLARRIPRLGGVSPLGAASAPAPKRAASDRSIAVLPFENQGATVDDQYFADGLSEDLITLLTKSADVRVVAYRAVADLRGPQPNVRDVAQRLRVSYLMRGSVRKQNDRVLVSAQLLDAESDTVLWSAEYDRPFVDFLAVRNEIVANAVRALRTSLLASALTEAATTQDAESYNLVLRGRAFFTEVTPENVTKAITSFNDALRRDPRNAAAYAGLARAFRTQAGQGWIPTADGYARSRAAARRAIDLDPQLADGYEALAFVQSAYDWQWEDAEANFRRALALEPGNARVMRSAALLMMKVGRYEEAIAGLRHAVERDPFAGTYDNLGYALGAAGRWDEAEGAARTAMTLGPNGILRHFNLSRALLFRGRLAESLKEIEQEKKESWRLMGLAIVYHALGRRDESNRTLADFEARYAEHSAMQIAEVYAYRGEKNAAFTWLERAYAQRDPGITDLKDDPWLSGLRADARYGNLLKRLNL